MTHKFGAKKKTVNGITFASTLEADRYKQLLQMEQDKRISRLECFMPFILQEGFKNEKTKKKYQPITYICDFSYYDEYRAMFVVEDVKGFKTPVYSLKKKLFIKKFGDMYWFREITAKDMEPMPKLKVNKAPVKKKAKKQR